jgi:DNA-directed RNA polymerase subunit RPC12/RpoP
MKIFLNHFTRPLFPCPICGEGLAVRESKKKKPYVVCNACGVQMFVRTAPGIQKFDKLVADAEARNIWERLRKLGSQYQKKCPQCGKSFWVDYKRFKTSWFDGSAIGYVCPEPGCEGIAPLEEEE